MNVSEATNVYLSDATHENICKDTFKIKLICDRGTKRVYRSDGTSIELTIEHLSNEDWYVIKNQ